MLSHRWAFPVRYRAVPGDNSGPGRPVVVVTPSGPPDSLLRRAVPSDNSETGRPVVIVTPLGIPGSLPGSARGQWRAWRAGGCCHTVGHSRFVTGRCPVTIAGLAGRWLLSHRWAFPVCYRAVPGDNSETGRPVVVVTPSGPPDSLLRRFRCKLPGLFLKFRFSEKMETGCSFLHPVRLQKVWRKRPKDFFDKLTGCSFYCTLFFVVSMSRLSGSCHAVHA